MDINYDNYFIKKISKVENLKHFPFASFTHFQEAIKNKTIKTNIRMDIARKWILSSNDAPQMLHKFFQFLTLIPFIWGVPRIVRTYSTKQ